MADIAIRVEGLSKRYTIGRRHVRRTAREALMAALSAPVGMARRALGSRHDRGAAAERTLWALKDVTFDVKLGEVVGVIGRNGAGKSTLLRILSRITEPTRGEAEIFGRVGSLLEVGTGFHPDLTGRENIYLNGAILGMRRAEVARIRRFHLVTKELDHDDGEVTATMKVRRASIYKAYGAEIEALYR